MSASEYRPMSPEQDSLSPTTRPSGGSGRSDRFPEPQAWSLNWDAHTADILGSSYGVSAADEKGASSRRDGLDKFPEPNGWAMNWDGYSIAALQEYYNPGCSSDRQASGSNKV